MTGQGPQTAREDRRRRRGSSGAPEPAGDLGPVQARRNGRVLVEAVGDPDRPDRTIRRGRAACPIRALWTRGRLTDAELAAAERVRDLAELALPGGLVASWQGTGAGGGASQPGDRQIAAAAELRRAWQVAGQAGAELVRRWAIDGETVKAIAGSADEDAMLTMGRLRAALTRLAEAGFE